VTQDFHGATRTAELVQALLDARVAPAVDSAAA
jgi:hypothetical protein